MVLIFSSRNGRIEREITEILCSYGGTYVSDSTVIEGDSRFTVVSRRKAGYIKAKHSLALFLDSNEKFNRQRFSRNTVGICESSNTAALTVFKRNKIPVLCFGMNSRNTVTLSGIDSDTVSVSIRRTFTDINSKLFEPIDFKLKLKSAYHPISVMACVSVLLMHGIIPNEL